MYDRFQHHCCCFSAYVPWLVLTTPPKAVGESRILIGPLNTSRKRSFHRPNRRHPTPPHPTPPHPTPPHPTPRLSPRRCQNSLSALVAIHVDAKNETKQNITKKTFRLLSDNANQQSGGGHSSDGNFIGGGGGGGGDLWGRAQGGVSREEERRRSLALHSDLPTPYLVVTNLPLDVTREELFEAFR